MSTKKLFVAMLIVFGLASFPAMVFAEVIEGKIASLDPSANYMTIVRLSPATGQSEELKVLVPPDTAFMGAKTLQDLKTGDEVAIKASEDKAAGVLKATSVELQKS